MCSIKKKSDTDNNDDYSILLMYNKKEMTTR